MRHSSRSAQGVLSCAVPAAVGGWPERKEVDVGVLEQYVVLRATSERQHEVATQGPWVGPENDRAGLATQTQLQTVPCTSSCPELRCIENVEVP